jgi:hypothetical protein
MKLRFNQVSDGLRIVPFVIHLGPFLEDQTGQRVIIHATSRSRGLHDLVACIICFDRIHIEFIVWNKLHPGQEPHCYRVPSLVYSHLFQPHLIGASMSSPENITSDVNY